MQYVPVLKWKQGEWQALGGLDNQIKSATTPLLEMTPSTDSFDTCEDYVQDRALKRLAPRWHSECFADVNILLQYDEVSAEEAFNWIGESVKDTDLTCVPVVWPRHHHIVEGATELAGKIGRACIRVDRSATIQPGLSTRLDEIATALSLDRGQVDIIVDLQNSLSVQDARGLLSHIPSPEEWRNIILAGGAFQRPTGTNVTAMVTRTHLQLWNQLRGELHYPLIFSDFGAIEPEYMHIEGYVEVVAQISYTEASSWFVARGERVSVSGWEQTQQLSAQVVNSGHFLGANFSQGDHWIANRANGAGTSGNATKLVEVRQSHHMTHVVSRDLAIPF